MVSKVTSPFASLEKVANAILYEGFLLYPYRKSSLKNQRRFRFGTLSAKGSGHDGSMQTQCLYEGDERTRVDLGVRFLQDDCERKIEVLATTTGNLRQHFDALEAAVEWESAAVEPGLFRLTVRITNVSEGRGEEFDMLSTHTLLALHDGAFISLLDPPERFIRAAGECQNIGTWPVLGGARGTHALMLSSPIILYDYPQITAESAGDFFDSTEIDEILSLRVLTLSEREKQEILSDGGRGTEILQRTEELTPGGFVQMHGVVRPQVQKGDRVRLHPRKRADIFDIALNGKVAIVEAVETDFEERVHLAVTVADDPGRDFGVAGQIGHRFFFGLDEIERL